MLPVQQILLKITIKTIENISKTLLIMGLQGEHHNPFETKWFDKC